MPQPPFSRTISEGSGDGAGLAIEGTNARPFGLDFLQDVISVSWGSLGFLVFSGTTAGLASQDGENWVSVTYPIAATCGAFGDGKWIISDGKGAGAVSKDTGKTWNSITLPDKFNFLAYIKPDKRAKKGIFGATSGTRSIFYTSTDSGGTWQKFVSDRGFSFDSFLVGVGNIFITEGAASGVVEPEPPFGNLIPLPFSFFVYSGGGWGIGSAFDSVPWDQLTADPLGERCDIVSVTAAYDPETEQYKLWAIADADGQALMSVTSDNGFSWSGSTLEYTPGFSAELETELGLVFTGVGVGGNGVLLIPIVKAILDTPGHINSSTQTSGVLINGNFDATPGQSGHFTFGPTAVNAGGAAFCKKANNGAGLFAVGFYISDGNKKFVSAKISTSAEGSAWNSINVPIAPISIVVGDISGFLAAGEPIA